MIRGLGAMIFKELRQTLRDPATLVLALAIPTVQLTIFGYAIDTEVRDVPLVVLDRCRTAESRRYVETLTGTRVLRLDGHVDSPRALFAELRAGRASVGVVIPERFARDLLDRRTAHVQVLIDGSSSTVASQVQAAALQAGVAMTAELAAARGLSAPPPAPAVEARPRMLYNPDQRSERFFVPGLAAIIMQLVTMLLCAFSVVRERERGTLEQLLVTPISRGGLLLGKLLPFVLIGVVETSVVLLAMVVVFDVPIRGSLTVLAGVTLVFLACSLALGLLISTIATNQLQAMMLSFLVLMPSVLLSGFVFPRETMPVPIQWLSAALPATHFVPVMRGVVLRAAQLEDLRPQLLALTGLGCAFMGLGLVRFRKRLG